MMNFLIYFLVTFVILFCLYKYLYRMYPTIAELPTDPSFPLIGHIHLVGSHPYEYLNNIYKLYERHNRKPLRFQILTKQIVVLSNVKDIEVILQNPAHLKKAYFYDVMRPWLGDGMLASTGMNFSSLLNNSKETQKDTQLFVLAPKYQKHRKVINSSFQFSLLVEFCDPINKIVDIFIKKLHDVSKNDEIINVQSLMYNCALDILFETTMGVNIDSINNPQSEVFNAYHTGLVITQGKFFSITQFNKLLYMMTPSYWRERKCLKIFRGFISEAIHKRADILKKMIRSKNNEYNLTEEEIRKSKKKVFMDSLLTATVDGRPFTFDEIFDEVANFMIAGHDTSANTTAAVLYLLSRHPEEQEKVFKEQKLIFGDDVNGDVTYQNTQEMKYLELVIREALRLYQTAPFIGRELTESLKLNGKTYPRGTTFALLLFSLGYDEKNFPDARKFDPERFLDKDQLTKHYPFSSGIRSCPGQKFGMLEMKINLSKIIRNFEILPAVDGLPPFKAYDPGEKPKNEYEFWYSDIIVGHSCNGVHIRLRPR